MSKEDNIKECLTNIRRNERHMRVVKAEIELKKADLRATRKAIQFWKKELAEAQRTKNGGTR